MLGLKRQTLHFNVNQDRYLITQNNNKKLRTYKQDIYNTYSVRLCFLLPQLNFDLCHTYFSSHRCTCGLWVDI